MKIEQMVCSLELAKELKELGVPQKSQFLWVDYADKKFGVNWQIRFLDGANYENFFDSYSAFLSDELLMWLPSILDYSPLSIYKENDTFIIQYYGIYVVYVGYCETQDDFLPNALAKMLIYLLKNNFLTSSELGSRR